MENQAEYTFDEVQLPPEPEWGPSAFDMFLPERPAQAQPTTSDDHKFKLWRGKDILNAPPKEWYYRGIVGAHDTVIVFGQSGSGKTYLMLDLALAAVSSGPFAHCFEFEGNRALRVAYMTHEGTSGIGARLASMTGALGLRDDAWDNLYIYTDILQFTLPNGKFGVNQFIEQALADTNGEGFDILILDHLSATLPGKGDSDGPTATLVDMEVDRLKCALNCSVIFGHHTGWNNDRSRGMSNYRDVSDQMIKVEGLDNPHTINCDKVKDGEKWGDKFFKKHRGVEL